MINMKSPEFKEEVKKIIEESIETYKMKHLKEVFLTKEEFREEMEKQRSEFREAMEKQRSELRETMKNHDLEMTRVWQELQKQREELSRAIKILSVSIMTMQNKTGPALERIILDIMRETLLMEKIDPEKMRKEILIDRDGVIFPANYSTDVDVLLENENTYLVEVTATADNRDIYHFTQCSKLYEKIMNKKPVGLILITLRINQRNYNLAQDHKMKVIAGEII